MKKSVKSIKNFEQFTIKNTKKIKGGWRGDSKYYLEVAK